MQAEFHVLKCVCKLQVNGSACFYVSREETSMYLNMLVNRSIAKKLCLWFTRLTLKKPEKLQLYGLYVYYVVHICDFGMLRVKM